MTVIVYDGNTLCADMRSLLNGTIVRESKIRAIKVIDTTYYVAQCGSSRYMERVIDWLSRNLHLEPFDREDYPMHGGHEQQGNGHVAVVAYVDAEGVPHLHCYEADKYPEVYALDLQPKHSFGTGAQYALGAMAMGANGPTSIKVAMMLCASCGDGYEGYNIRTGERFINTFDVDWNSDVRAPAGPEKVLGLEEPAVCVAEEVEE